MAERQRSKFARIYGYSVASIIFFHFFINIGMTIGLLPVIGIPLPFISYGGTSYLFTGCAIGIIQSICQSSKEKEENLEAVNIDEDETNNINKEEI